MARRKRSKGKQKEELVQAILGLVAFLGFFGTYYFTESLETAVIVTILSVAVVISCFTLVYLHRASQRNRRLKLSGITDIDRMDGLQFEKYLDQLFRSQGYRVQVTKGSGDFGADLVLQKDSKKIVVQAKRYSKNVGIEAVQQAYGAKNFYEAGEAWVLSNRDYTEAARKLARSNGVRLIGREELINMILKMNPGSVVDPKRVIEENPSPTKTCTRCGKPMVIRKGPKGDFLGCSAFPKCRNVISISKNK